ncbi:Protection of telomeres protein 1b [Acorus calamus]|uniref:Protection of telomeres protein 1b n=1 Tax=Acorus calamus TaxID=4465 RepID=A0AAV9FM14_ACOCL|nr:Protection of telomeres protein 1b [Acorus calamus]
MAGQDDYMYLPLVDARAAINIKINLFAVVTEIGDSKHSKGTDYVCTLKIVDQSYPSPGISVNFFAEAISKLPRVKSCGDIIRLHRVLMQIYNGEVYCVFKKQYSSFALFEGKNSDSFIPYQFSAKIYVDHHDKEHVGRLRTWFLKEQADAGVSNYSVQLKEIKTGGVFDLVCKVLYTCQAPGDEWILFVWDGTDTPPVRLQTDLDLEGKKPAPLHMEPSPLPVHVFRTFPHVGSILRISSGKYFEEIQLLQGVARWVKVRNMKCEIHSGLWKGVLEPVSKVRLLSDENDMILLRERNFNERISSGVHRWPSLSPSSLTETDYEHAAYATLMESLTHPVVTHKCKSIVRVIAAYPWRGEDLRSPVGGHYRIRLTLEDPTARIHAYIYGEDGVDFFGGRPASDVLSNKMNKLLGITKDKYSTFRDPPWVWCCLKSYYLDKNDAWGSRRYRVFATRLIS